MKSTFLRFVEERHRIWEQRQLDLPQPWTEDPILASRKFTNVFRILDPGTQFLLTDLYPGADDWNRLLRAFLYRHTGQIEAWKAVLAELGEYPTTTNLDTVHEVWENYRRGNKLLFTSAYMVNPQSHTPGTNKLDSIIALTKRVFHPGFFEDWCAATTPGRRFELLRSFSYVGDFMSMQILTDWGYQDPSHDEDEFVQLGPGAVKGSKALGESVHWALEHVRELPVYLTLPHGVIRRPSLMDVQNCLCEFSKYVRLTPSSSYAPAHPGPQSEPLFPNHW